MQHGLIRYLVQDFGPSFQCYRLEDRKNGGKYVVERRVAPIQALGVRGICRELLSTPFHPLNHPSREPGVPKGIVVTPTPSVPPL